MTDEAFHDLLSQCRAELQSKQDAFIDSVQQGQWWHYDLDQETLSIGSQTFRITVIGSFDNEDQSWLWAWANDSFPQAARDSSAKIKQLHESTRFQVFLDAGTDATSADAQDLSALAIHWLGADGLFRVPGKEGPTMYFAVYLPAIIDS